MGRPLVVEPLAMGVDFEGFVHSNRNALVPRRIATLQRNWRPSMCAGTVHANLHPLPRGSYTNQFKFDALGLSRLGWVAYLIGRARCARWGLLAGRGDWGGSLLPEGWPAYPLRPIGSVGVVVFLVGNSLC